MRIFTLSTAHRARNLGNGYLQRVYYYEWWFGSFNTTYATLHTIAPSTHAKDFKLAGQYCVTKLGTIFYSVNSATKNLICF